MPSRVDRFLPTARAVVTRELPDHAEPTSFSPTTTARSQVTPIDLDKPRFRSAGRVYITNEPPKQPALDDVLLTRVRVLTRPRERRVRRSSCRSGSRGDPSRRSEDDDPHDLIAAAGGAR
jgi:hypothetical protein